MTRQEFVDIGRDVVGDAGRSLVVRRSAQLWDADLFFVDYQDALWFWYAALQQEFMDYLEDE
jgi:hypothetical protein